MGLYDFKYLTRAVSVPGPTEFRIPTEAEWNTEIATWSTQNAAGAFGSVLKLPVAGRRDNIDGSLGVGSFGFYQSSNLDGSDSRNLFFFSSGAAMGSYYRAYGGSVRLIKDEPYTGLAIDFVSEEITINNLPYNTVLNETTNRIWLDRNLGAAQVATSSTDSDAYGDLYQWGRGTDGHEKRDSGTTETLSATDQPGHNDFILAPSSPYDWRDPQNDLLWQGVDGINNPAPAGVVLSYKLLTRNSKALYSYEQGLYSIEEIDALIADGYIPVASANELDSLRTATLKPMGVGTRWGGHYLTGLAGKYVQVQNIDLSAYNPWIGFGIVGNNFVGDYKGNGLSIINYVGNIGTYSGLFRVSSIGTISDITIQGSIPAGVGPTAAAGILIGASTNQTISNINVYANISGDSLNQSGGLIGRCDSVTVSNINIFGTISGTTKMGGCVGDILGGNSTFFNINNYANINGTTIIGGIMGGTGGTVIIENVYNYGSITGTQQVGGLVGRTDGTNPILKKSYNHGEVIGQGTDFSVNFYYGGIVGYMAGTTARVEDSYNTGAVLGYRFAGGVSGGLPSGRVIENSYNIGLVTGTVDPGPIIGQTGGTLINTYYNNETTGFTAGAGEPRTTLQLQQGTADSFILPGGGTDPDNLPANSVFTTWSNAIWNFLTNIQYPKLR